MKAVYCRLRDRTIGAKVFGDVERGDWIEVDFDNMRHREIVERVLWSGNGIKICRLRPRPQRPLILPE